MKLFILSCLTCSYAQESGFYGALDLPSNQQQTMAAISGEDIVYHTYRVEVPAGSAQLIISINGYDHDFDLAAKAGSEIQDYESDYDFIDLSEDPNPSFAINNPAAGSWFIDVINSYDTSATYGLQLSVVPTKTQSPPAQQQGGLSVSSTIPASSSVLIGTWEHGLEDIAGFSITWRLLSLLSDGRYFYSETPDYSNEATKVEEGRYRFADDTLYLEPWCSEAYTLQVQQQGKDLVFYFEDNIEQVWQYRTNSEVTTPQEFQELDASRAEKYAAYSQHIPLAAIVSGPSPLEAGITERPDPNPQEIYDSATVFAEQELYNYFSSYYWFKSFGGGLTQTSAETCAILSDCEAFRNPAHPRYRDQLTYLFFPNGRYYIKVVTYVDAVDLSTNPVVPNIQDGWGRYSVQGNEILLEDTLDGSKAYYLLDGRTVLSGDGLCIPEVEFAS